MRLLTVEEFAKEAGTDKQTIVKMSKVIGFPTIKEGTIKDTCLENFDKTLSIFNNSVTIDEFSKRVGCRREITDKMIEIGWYTQRYGLLPKECIDRFPENYKEFRNLFPNFEESLSNNDINDEYSKDYNMRDMDNDGVADSKEQDENDEEEQQDQNEEEAEDINEDEDNRKRKNKKGETQKNTSENHDGILAGAALAEENARKESLSREERIKDEDRKTEEERKNEDDKKDEQRRVEEERKNEDNKRNEQRKTEVERKQKENSSQTEQASKADISEYDKRTTEYSENEAHDYQKKTDEENARQNASDAMAKAAEENKRHVEYVGIGKQGLSYKEGVESYHATNNRSDSQSSGNTSQYEQGQVRVIGSTAYIKDETAFKAKDGNNRDFFNAAYAVGETVHRNYNKMGGTGALGSSIPNGANGPYRSNIDNRFEATPESYRALSRDNSYDGALRRTGFAASLTFSATRLLARSSYEFSKKAFNETDAGRGTHKIAEPIKFAGYATAALVAEGAAKRTATRLSSLAGQRNSEMLSNALGGKPINLAKMSKANMKQMTRGLNQYFNQKGINIKLSNMPTRSELAAAARKLGRAARSGIISGDDVALMKQMQSAINGNRMMKTTSNRAVMMLNMSILSGFSYMDSVAGVRMMYSMYIAAKTTIQTTRMSARIVARGGRAIYTGGRRIVSLTNNTQKAAVKRLNDRKPVKARVVRNPTRTKLNNLRAINGANRHGPQRLTLRKKIKEGIGRTKDRFKSTKLFKMGQKIFGGAKNIFGFFAKFDSMFKLKVILVLMAALVIYACLTTMVLYIGMTVGSVSSFFDKVADFFKGADGVTIADTREIRNEDGSRVEYIIDEDASKGENIFNIITDIYSEFLDEINKAKTDPTYASDEIKKKDDGWRGGPIYGFYNPNTGTRFTINKFGSIDPADGDPESSPNREYSDATTHKYIDGDKNETGRTSNIKEVMSMSHGFVRGDYNYFGIYAAYAEQLWRCSNDVTYKIIGLNNSDYTKTEKAYECPNDTCKDGDLVSYHCDNSLNVAKFGGAIVKYGDAEINEKGNIIGTFSAGGLCSPGEDTCNTWYYCDRSHCSNGHAVRSGYWETVDENGGQEWVDTSYWKCDGHCGGHTANVCCGHVNLEVTQQIIGFEEENNLYKVDTMNEIITDPNMKKDVRITKIGDKTVLVKYYWQGWNDANKQFVDIVYDADWQEIYGINFTGIMGTPLSGAEAGEYIDLVNTLYPTLSEARGAVVNYALNSVGRVPYRYGGYASSPGYPVGALDCSHWVIWVYWSTLGENFGGPGDLKTAGVAVDINSLHPGDILITNGHDHVGMFLYYDTNGNIVCAEETTDAGRNVGIMTRTKAWWSSGTCWYRRVLGSR